MSTSGPGYTATVSTPPSVTSTPPATPTENPKMGFATMNPATTAKLAGTVVGTKPAPMKLEDAALQNWLTFTMPAVEKAEADKAYAALGPAYATFAAASSAYETKLNQCRNTSWTTNQIVASCLPADSLVTCSIKLADKCVASEKATMLRARVAVGAAASSLATAAGALSVLTH